ncbi:MAG: hypothetical protein DCC58_13015 [Chloroflexi bacterium]|nr:MAG: hypothetical protein DCC58_13015 [Chloroflexota bacterium]
MSYQQFDDWYLGETFPGWAPAAGVLVFQLPSSGQGSSLCQCRARTTSRKSFGHGQSHHWSLVTGHSSLVTRHWSLVTGHSSLVTRHWSLVTQLGGLAAVA